MKNWILAFLFYCCATSLSGQQIWHVNQAATGGNNGNTWADAFVNLQSALVLADYGDEVWVAKGIYLPTEGVERKISFNLSNGVGLYGGFSANETTLSQRNPSLNPTILSGDIGISGVLIDNSYHVVNIYGGDDNTVLDGFTITLGYGADAFSGFPDEYGGGVLVVADITIPLAIPIIAQCRFVENRAGSGGGLACIGDASAICSPDIRQCIFERNLSGYYGGALYKFGRNRSDRAFSIYDCVFESNRSETFGGGITIYEPTDTVRITQCTFVKDTAIEAGGAFLWSGNQNVRYEIDECDFIANYTSSSAPGIEHLFPGFTPIQKIELVVKRSLFFLNHNFVGIGGGITSKALSDVELHHVEVEECVFESNHSQNGGAGIFVEGGDAVYSEVSVDKCFFLGNETGASSVAGAFYYRAFGSKLARNKNTITNSVFMWNDGAIASLGGKPGITHTRVANCSFYRNGAIPFVKYWGVENNPVDLEMKMEILNSVIWEPQTEGVHRLFYNNDPSNFTVNDYLVEHSMINLSDCNYNSEDPCGEGMIYGQWPNFIDSTGQLGLRTWDFAGRNRGSNLVVDTLGIEHDYLGVSRVYCDTVDMGAYEMQGLCISATNDLHFSALPLGVHLIQNPIQKGMPIEVELFGAISLNLQVILVEANGRVVWKESVSIPEALPSVFSIPSDKLNPGLFYLQIMDEHGKSKTEKLVVF